VRQQTGEGTSAGDVAKAAAGNLAETATVNLTETRPASIAKPDVYIAKS